jgi:hypothetical protein
MQYGNNHSVFHSIRLACRFQHKVSESLLHYSIPGCLRRDSFGTGPFNNEKPMYRPVFCFFANEFTLAKAIRTPLPHDFHIKAIQ